MTLIKAMQTDQMELLHKDLSEKILKAFYKVHNELGFGFLEKVYENALFMELRSMGVFCMKQKPIQVYYNTHIVGEYLADIVVSDLIIIELKAAEAITEEYENQLVNYLKATEIEVGLLLNFGKTPQFKQKVFANDRKKALSA